MITHKLENGNQIKLNIFAAGKKSKIPRKDFEAYLVFHVAADVIRGNEGRKVKERVKEMIRSEFRKTDKTKYRSRVPRVSRKTESKYFARGIPGVLPTATRRRLEGKKE